MLERPRSQAVTRIRALFKEAGRSLTITDIRAAIPDLLPSQISMSLCYFMRQKYVTREPTDNPRPKERKQVWLYTYKDKPFTGWINED